MGGENTTLGLCQWHGGWAQEAERWEVKVN